jgi:hypothetical protein
MARCYHLLLARVVVGELVRTLLIAVVVTALHSCQFRFLLMMHEVLDGRVADDRLKEYLQRRIKNACMGFIRWHYDITERPPVGGWHLLYHPSGTAYPSATAYATYNEELGIWASYNVLFLYEFLRTFPQELDFVLDKIKSGRVVSWLENVKKQRHQKSKIWARKETDESVEWYDRDYRDEQIKVSHFRLSFLVVLWRALQFLQKICEAKEPSNATVTPQMQAKPGTRGKQNVSSAGGISPTPNWPFPVDGTSVSSQRKGSVPNMPGDPGAKDPDPKAKDPLEKVQKMMHEAPQTKTREDINKCLRDLSPADIRSKIIERFTFTPQNLTANSDPRTVKRKLSVCRSAILPEARTHFHASDAVLFDAVEWGFFDDEPSESVLPAWTETVASQDKTDKDWDTPLRYALALRMADRDQPGKKENFTVRTEGIIPGDVSMASLGPGEREAWGKSLAKRERSPAKLRPESNSQQEGYGRSKPQGRAKNLLRLRRILMNSVLSSGLFAHELELDISKRPKRNLSYDNTQRRYEVPCILLRFDFPTPFLTR